MTTTAISPNRSGLQRFARACYRRRRTVVLAWIGLLVGLITLNSAAAGTFRATIVRMVLVPATMELLGDRNWWLPRALDRRLPVVHVDVVEADRSIDRRVAATTDTSDRAASSDH